MKSWCCLFWLTWILVCHFRNNIWIGVTMFLWEKYFLNFQLQIKVPRDPGSRDCAFFALCCILVLFLLAFDVSIDLDFSREFGNTWMYWDVLIALGKSFFSSVLGDVLGFVFRIWDKKFDKRLIMPKAGIFSAFPSQNWGAKFIPARQWQYCVGLGFCIFMYWDVLELKRKVAGHPVVFSKKL